MKLLIMIYLEVHIGGLVQERRDSIANALELRRSCINQPIWYLQHPNQTIVLFIRMPLMWKIPVTETVQWHNHDCHSDRKPATCIFCALGHRYRIKRNFYSLVSIILAPICASKNNRRIWRHNTRPPFATWAIDDCFLWVWVSRT